MLKKNPESERIFGLLVVCLGGFFAYLAWVKLSSYVQTGQIIFDSHRAAPVYGTEAAFWYTAYMLLGLWMVAYGIGLVFRK